MPRGRRKTDPRYAGQRRRDTEVYSPTAVVWHNNDRRELDVSELLEVVQIIQRRTDCSIDVELRQVTEDGFLQRHTAKYAFVDGTTAWIIDPPPDYRSSGPRAQIAAGFDAGMRAGWKSFSSTSSTDGARMAI